MNEDRISQALVDYIRANHELYTQGVVHEVGQLMACGVRQLSVAPKPYCAVGRWLVSAAKMNRASRLHQAVLDSIAGCRAAGSYAQLAVDGTHV